MDVEEHDIDVEEDDDGAAPNGLRHENDSGAERSSRTNARRRGPGCKLMYGLLGVEIALDELEVKHQLWPPRPPRDHYFGIDQPGSLLVLSEGAGIGSQKAKASRCTALLWSSTCHNILLITVPFPSQGPLP